MIASTKQKIRGSGTAFFLFLTVSGLATADTPDTRPFWTEQAVFHFGDDVFFTGRASCAPNVETGRQRAYGAAIQEIQNFVHAGEVSGFPIDTQMIFEEPRPSDCGDDAVTVWRLLRVPRTDLDAFARRRGSLLRQDVSPIDIQTKIIRNLTPRIGMLRDEIWQRYGQPRSVWMNPETGEATWEYPRFGMVLVLDQEDSVTHWRLSGPHSRATLDQPGIRPSDQKILRSPELPTIDLTDRLRELEERQDNEYRNQAMLYCSIRFPNPLHDLVIHQRISCEQREYERLKFPRRPN